MEKKLAFHAALEVLKLEAYVYSDGSYNEEKDPERKCSGRTEVVKSGIQAGLLDFLRNSEGHNPVRPLLFKMRHGMFILGERSTEEQIESVAHMVLAGKSGKAIQGGNLMEDVLMQMKFRKLLKNDLKAKISNALSTRKKAGRNGFHNLLGYAMMSPRVTSEYILCIAQKNEYENNKREFLEKLLK